MARAWIREGVDLKNAERENVAVDFYGKAFLVSLNNCPNPDLRDFTNTGQPEYWILDAPDAPDGWAVYMRQESKTKTNGQQERVKNSVHRKQSLNKLSLKRSYFEQRGDLVSGSTLPDAQKRAKIAPPSEIRVKVMTEKNKADGFPGGTKFVTYFLIMGEDPINSSRITAAAPPSRIDLLQGQRIGVPIPDVSGQGVTGIGFAVGNNAEDTFEQMRIDLRLDRPETRVINGPLRKGIKINAKSPNRTTVSGNTSGGVPGKREQQQSGRQVNNVSGSPNANQIENMHNGSSMAQQIIDQLKTGGRPDIVSEPLQTRYGPSEGALQPMDTLISFRYVTEDGVGEMLSAVALVIEDEMDGYSYQFRPNEFPEEATGYIAMILGDDGVWQRLINLEDGGRTVEFAPDEWASVTSDHVPADDEDLFSISAETGQIEIRPTQPMIADESVEVGGISLYEELPEEQTAPIENTTDPVVDDEEQSSVDTDEDASADAGNFLRDPDVGTEDRSGTTVSDLLHDAPGKDERSVFSAAGVPYMGWHTDRVEGHLISRINERREQMGFGKVVVNRSLNIEAYRAAGGARDSEDPEDLGGRTFTDSFVTERDDFEEAYRRLASHLVYRENLIRIGVAREVNPEGPGYLWEIRYSDAPLGRAKPVSALTCATYEPDGTSHVFKASGEEEYVGSFAVDGAPIEGAQERAESVRADAATETGFSAVSAGDRMDFSYNGSYAASLDNAAASWDGIAWGCQRVSSGAQVAVSDGDVGGYYGMCYYGGPGSTTIVGSATELARQPGFRNQKMWCHELGHAAGQMHQNPGTRSVMVQGFLDWNTPQQFDKDKQIGWYGAGGPSGSGSSGGSSGGTSGSGTTSSSGSSGSSGTTTTPEQEGLENPTTPLEGLFAVGAERQKPGVVECRTTYTLKDDESGPSPAKRVKLRDTGLAKGQSASGVTDQYVRVYTPGQQRITNAENSEQDRDGIDLDWEIPTYPTGLTVNTADGRILINDRTNANSEQLIRLGEKFEINPIKLHTIRQTLSAGDGWTGGRLSAHVSFFNSSGTLIRTVLLGKTRKKRGERILKRCGPRGMPGRSEKCDFFIPAAARFAQIFWKVSPQYGNRNSYYEVENILFAYNSSGGRKRYNLGLGLTNDRDQRNKATDGEDPDRPYPVGPYCRIVRNPDDPAYHMSPQYLERLEFEGTSGLTLPSPFSLSVSSGVDARIRSGVKVYSEVSQALLLEKTAGNSTQTSAYVRVAPTYLPTRNTFAYRMCMKLQDIWASGAPRLMRINRVGGGQGIELYHTPNDTLRIIVPNGGSTATLDVEEDISEGDRLKVEVLVKNAGTSGASVEVNLWKNERRVPTVKLLSLNWSAVTFQHADCGVMSLVASETFTVVMDRIALTEQGDRDAEYIPGNYIEYWAPELTPPGDYFARGMRIPIAANVDNIFSFYFGSENIDRPANIMTLAIKDSRNRVIKSLGPMIKGVEGDTLWKRYWKHFKTDVEGAYLEITGNRVGGGLLRAMGFQLEEDRTEAQGPRPFDNTNATDGHLIVYFDTGIPGGDPLAVAMSLGSELVRGGAIVEHEPGTSHDIDFSSAAYLSEIEDAPFYETVPQLVAAEGQNQIVGLKLELHSNNNTRSPVVRGLFVDVKRDMAQLLKADGSEYRYGCLAFKIEPEDPRRNIVQQLYADGTTGFEDLTRGAVPRYLSGLAFQCYSREVATQIVNDCGRDGGLFTLDFRGIRYKIRPQKFAFKRYGNSEWAQGDHVNRRHELYRAEDVEAEIISAVKV